MDIKQLLLGDENFVHLVEDFSKKNNISFNPEYIHKFNLNNDSVDNIIEKAPTNSKIFIKKINDLGKSSFQILKNINNLKNKNITLHVINKNVILHLKNELLFQVLETLLEFEKNKIEHRTQVSKDTREKRNTKLGRKTGQPIKSKYEKHKRRILYLHGQGVPNTKIIKDIQLGTPQSLGKYIKEIKQLQKNKQKKEGTYFLKENDIKDVNKSFGSL
jgi:hypothetical protein